MKNFSILLIILINLTPVQTNAQNISIELNQNWQFKNQKENKWYKATVPGTVHTDLLANKLIPDPFYRDNESKLQWIDKADWEYRTVFNVDAKTFEKKNIELIFDGLDTYADVYLNGRLILQADNMFRGWTVDIKSVIKRTNNVLLVKFASAQNKVDSVAKSKLPLVLPDNNRVYVRKAQFQFGWDWGPKFVGSGIWKTIKLEGWDSFKVLSSTIKISPDKNNLKDDSLILYIQADSTKRLFTDVIVSLTKKNKDNKTDTFTLIPFKYSFGKGINRISLNPNQDAVFNVKEIKDNLKDITSIFIKIYTGKRNVNYKFEYISASSKIVFSQVKLIQQKDSIGTSFYFEKDGKPIYCKGANWIPGDIFLPRLTRADYRRMLLSAKSANMNMLRVWGGGVYESDDFYDLCDSLDIMVWQDFMFAGGMYPGDKAFMNNVREEVKYQIERLKDHPCIVLWCGNNEVEEAWKNWGWQNQFNLHGADSTKVWNDYKRLFQDSLKKWVDEFDGTRPYVSTSPKNGWGRKESFTEGDSHYWGVWWGMEDWEKFETKTGRFVSEYGMQAMPNWNTIKSFTDSSDRFLYSPVIKDHQKASDGFKKLNHYLTRYFIDSAKLSRLSLEDYTYLSQCMQYYILKNSIAIHRSKYPSNMGSLLWQLNDCWPVTSWSITDYSRQPKAAWYAVREAYRDNYFESRFEDGSFKIKLNSNESRDFKIASYRFYSPDSKLLFVFSDTLDSEKYPEVAHALSTSTISIDTSEFSKKYGVSFKDVIVYAYFSNRKAPFQNWSNTFSFNYPKSQKLQNPNPGLLIMPHDNSLTISSKNFARFVCLEMEGVRFSDNYFDLPPNTLKTIYFSSETTNDEVYKNISIKSLYNVLNAQ